MKYYTYAYLREDRTPYYIGKGQGNRAYRRSKKCIKPPKDRSRIIYLKQNLTEEEAFKHEIYMIAVFGRIDLGTGILHNKTDGGEGVSGYLMKEEQKRTLSKIHGGKVLTTEHKRKISEGLKKANVGKYKRTPEQLLKMKINRKLIKYYLKHKDGTELIIDSMREFCKKNPHLDRSAMNRVGRGKMKIYKGWTVKKLDELLDFCRNPVYNKSSN